MVLVFMDSHALVREKREGNEPSLCDGVPPSPAVRLIICGIEACLTIVKVDIWHVLVLRLAPFLCEGSRRLRIEALPRIRVAPGGGDRGRLGLLGLPVEPLPELRRLLCGSLDEPPLDAHAPVGKVLSAAIPNLLVPNPPGSLPVELGDDGGAFSGGVDANAAVLVVDLTEQEWEKGR